MIGDISTMYISESRIINGDTYLTISGSVNVSLSRIGMKQLPKSNAMTIPSTCRGRKKNSLVKIENNIRYFQHNRGNSPFSIGCKQDSSSR